jgi:hypothetical protein
LTVDPHHAIPARPPESWLERTLNMTNTTASPTPAPSVAGEAAGRMASSPGIGGGHFLVVALVGALLLLLGLAAFAMPRVRSRSLQEEASRGSGGGPRAPYDYPGLRADLRRLFLRLRRLAAAKLGFEPRWATAREVAGIIEKASAWRFASRYEELMYGGREPSEPDVAVLRSLVEEAGSGEPEGG